MKKVRDDNIERITVRMSPQIKRDLRKISYLTEKSITQLFREGAAKVIDEYKKVLTNADIVA